MLCKTIIKLNGDLTPVGGLGKPHPSNSFFHLSSYCSKCAAYRWYVGHKPNLPACRLIWKTVRSKAYLVELRKRKGSGLQLEEMKSQLEHACLMLKLFPELKYNIKTKGGNLGGSVS